MDISYYSNSYFSKATALKYSIRFLLDGFVFPIETLIDWKILNNWFWSLDWNPDETKIWKKCKFFFMFVFGFQTDILLTLPAWRLPWRPLLSCLFCQKWEMIIWGNHLLYTRSFITDCLWRKKSPCDCISWFYKFLNPATYENCNENTFSLIKYSGERVLSFWVRWGNFAEVC